MSNWETSFVDPVLLQNETSTKLTLFILNCSISSRLFFPEVQWGSSLIDPVLLQEETYTKLTLCILGSFISSKLFFLEVL